MIKFSKDFIWKNEAWNLQKTVSGFKFNKNWRINNFLIRNLKEQLRLEIFRFLRFCQGLSFWRSLLAFDAWFWRYLSCLSALGSHRAAFRSRLWLVFVVAGGTLTSHCFLSMLDLDAICRGRTLFWCSLLVFDAWLWRYLSSLSALGAYRAVFRSRLWALFVVFQSSWLCYCLPSMLDSDAICRSRKHFGSQCFLSINRSTANSSKNRQGSQPFM